jgi:nitrogen regulatory protein P-II 1
MKKIECIIRPEKLKELAEKLCLTGISGLTAMEVKGFGRQTTRPVNYLFLPKTKVDIYIDDDQAEEVIGAITKVCRTGNIGDGKIVILPVDDAVRIRTGERKKQAIF